MGGGGGDEGKKRLVMATAFDIRGRVTWQPGNA